MITPAAKSLLDPPITKNHQEDPRYSSSVRAIPWHNASKNRCSGSSIIMARDLYRAEWHKKWTEEGLAVESVVPDNEFFY